MSFQADPRRVAPPLYWGKNRPEEHLRKIANSVRDLLDGKSNNNFIVTLDAGKAQTDVPYLPARSGVAVLLTPRNAAAAALQRTTNVFGEAFFEKVRICHDSSAAGTEEFSLVVIG